MTKDERERLVKVEAEVTAIKTLIQEVHTGVKWFIRGAKFTAALGALILFLKGVVPWGDVTAAFRDIA